jgi:hypothetical protein
MADLLPPFDDEPEAPEAPQLQLSPEEKKRMGRPPFEPTAVQRKTVAMMVAAGITQEEITKVVVNPETGKPIDVKTLCVHFEPELRESAGRANSAIAKSLFQKAIGDGPQAVTAAIFWAKCRMGWKERSVAEVEVKGGVLIAPSTLSPEQWIAAQAGANAAKSEPGSGSAG